MSFLINSSFRIFNICGAIIKSVGFIFEMFLKSDAVGSLAPIATVMPFSIGFAALAKWHLSEKRAALF